MSLPLTDRTRYLTGLQQCAMKRYLQFHAGPYGYGYQRKTTHIPLATGTYVHGALAAILNEVKDSGKVPSLTAIRLILSIQLAQYKREIDTATFAGVSAQDLDGVIQEQFTLVKGLVWAWVRVVLPTLVKEYEVVSVETEEVIDLGCDCGKGAPEDPHEELCLGVTQMSKPDFVLRHRVDKTLSNHDFKTTSLLTDQWIQEFKDSVQMAVGTLGVEARLKEPVETYFIHPLIKGQRKNDYDPDTKEYSGPKRQNSFLCYLYYRPGNPPLYGDDYQPKWKFTDEGGKGHTLGRNYQKTPVWEARFADKPKEQDNAEFWVSILPEYVLQEAFALIGPYQRNVNLIEQYQDAMPAEEQRWVNVLWDLYGMEDMFGWTSPLFQRKLNKLVPRSYNCFSYGSRCSFYDICIERKDTTWKDPLASGKYLPRRPHHQLELDQMIARGIPVPETEEVEEVA